jgi:hypothetical protein
MNTPKQGTQPRAPHNTYEPLSQSEEIEEATSLPVLASGVALRGIEIAAAVLLALLVCPALFILVVVVIVPLVATVVAVSLVAAVFAIPYLLVRRLRGHRSVHAALFIERALHAAHAVLDLLPHRVHGAARTRNGVDLG